MSRVFNKIAPTLWRSKSFLDLSGDGRLFYLFCLSSWHQNVCGCFPLPDGYAITDLRWPLEQYLTARAEVVANGLIMFDESTYEILVTKWFKHNLPMNPSHRKAAVTAIANIASATLRQAASEGMQLAEQEVKDRKAASTGLPTVCGTHLTRTAHMLRGQ